jgi:hypothetical protein
MFTVLFLLTETEQNSKAYMLTCYPAPLNKREIPMPFSWKYCHRTRIHMSQRADKIAVFVQVLASEAKVDVSEKA